MIQIGSKTISNIQFGSKTSTELYLGSTKIWPEGGSTETWPEGTFLYTKDNTYITADQYSSGYTKDDIIGVYHYDTTMYDDNSGFLTNPQPILIAIDVPEILSSAGISEVKACRNNSTSIIGVNTITWGDTYFVGTYTDWSGYENTQALNNLLATGTSIVEDAPYVAATCFAVDGRQGYVPSSAELDRAMRYATEIDALIERVGGTALVTGSTYVSSTKIVDSTGNGTVMFYTHNSSDGAGFAENTDDVEVLVFFKPGPYTCDYYGVKFEGDSTDGTRVGNLELAKSLPLQSKMKGCTLTSDGTVKYLNPTDWSKYEDGTDRDYSLNTMVELPEYWCYGANLTFGTGGDHIILVAENSTYGWYHFPKRYVSAYDATTETLSGNSNIASLSSHGDVTYSPVINRSAEDFRTSAKTYGNDWDMYTYFVHKQITWLFVTEYATRNSQESFFDGVDKDGYKIGGLGDGFTTLGSNKTDYSIGITDTLGNNTGEVSYDSSQMTRYRGIENPFGGVYKRAIGISAQSSLLYLSDDVQTPDMEPSTQVGVFMTGSAHCVSLKNSTGVQLEIFEDQRCTAEGSTTTYWCDYQIGSSASLYKAPPLIGGNTKSGGEAGLFAIRFNTGGSSLASAIIGTRLTYYPVTQ